MARIDDYRKAIEIGKAGLEQKDPQQMAAWAGAEIDRRPDGTHHLALNFLSRTVLISWPDLGIRYKDSGEDLPLQQQVLLLHYLKGSEGVKVEGQWIAYQEIPDGKFYLDAFIRRAKIPMVQAFGERPEQLVRLAAEVYGARPFDQGDKSVVIQALPLIPVALILWAGDDEFPPEGNILFDRSISRILSAEDTAWLAGMIVYPLMGMAKK